MSQIPLPEPPRFQLFMSEQLNQPMERWARQLTEYVQAVAVVLEEIAKQP